MLCAGCAVLCLCSSGLPHPHTLILVLWQALSRVVDRLVGGMECSVPLEDCSAKHAHATPAQLTKVVLWVDSPVFARKLLAAMRRLHEPLTAEPEHCVPVKVAACKGCILRG